MKMTLYKVMFLMLCKYQSQDAERFLAVFKIKEGVNIYNGE